MLRCLRGFTTTKTFLTLALVSLTVVMVASTIGWAEPSEVIFADDFSGDKVGDMPALWRVTGGRDYVHVVADPDVPSGKAVRILSDPQIAHTSIGVQAWKLSGGDADTMIIDHYLRWVRGKNNMYVTKSGSHRLHWWVSEQGQLQFNERRDNGTLGSVTVGPIQEGWNHIRLEANVTHQHVRFYLNDMEHPAGGPYRFGRELDSWDGATLNFSHTHSAEKPKEIYYADVKVWEPDEDSWFSGKDYISNARTLFQGQFSDDPSPGVNGLSTSDPAIVVEHAFRWVKGGVSFYLASPETRNAVRWGINGETGNLQYYTTYGGSTWAQNIGPIQSDWNQLRIVLDAERNQLYFYLNELEVPTAGPLAFQSAADDWKRFVLSVDAAPEVTGDNVEIYHGDVTIWSLGAEAVADFRALVGQGDAPIWIEYHDLDKRDPQWWATAEGRRLADRIVRTIQSGEIHIDVPIGTLTVPDGILPTQLNILARVYAATDDSRYKEAFRQGINILLEAQFASGGWPTIYPRFKDRDLHIDEYALATWTDIPALLRAVIARAEPFHTDVTDTINPVRLEEALERIPPRGSIRRFSYSHYAGNGAAWWQSEEAIRIGDNLISWQLPHGGWWRDEAWAVLPYSPETMRRSPVISNGVERGRSGRNGTVNPIRYVARLYEATGLKRFEESFYRGIDYLLDAQYPTGGWPNSYPDPRGNEQHVMYNDRAMVDVLTLLQDIVMERTPFQFVDDAYKARIEDAYNLGIRYILDSQIVVDGRLTAWGHQHDPFTYEPRPYRAFEPPSLSGSQSPNVVQFLMSIENPSEEIRRSILSALEWLQEARLPDGRWSVFYEIGTNRPIFAGRDAVVVYDLADIEVERQWGYGGWFGAWPDQLLKQVETSGYLDSLYESLPDHPTVRIRFATLKDGARISGALPLNLELAQPAHEADLESVTVRVDQNVVYKGDRLPGSDFMIDTEKLDEGRHVITAEVVHRQYGTFHRSVAINVNNVWRLVQNMRPPVVDSWFGTTDFLETADRSDGWGYKTGDATLFFGDPERLVRITDSPEYLVWKTPRLSSARVELFVRDVGVAKEDLPRGLVLEASPERNSDQDMWHQIPYQSQVDDPVQPGGWYRVTVDLELDKDAQANWFRLTLSNELTQEAVQIGRVVFAGYHD